MGWKYFRLGDVCDLMTGGTPSKSKPEYFNNGDIKWLVSGDIHQREIFECEGRITSNGLANSNAKFLPENSVLIALNGQGKTRGSVSLLRTKATCNQSLVSINPKDKNQLSSEFLYIYLHGKYEQLRKMTGDSGNDRRGLNMPLIRSIEIPLPPVSEQKRIVAVLDQAFAQIEQARAKTEQNLKNARELFESEKASAFEKLSSQFPRLPIAEVCEEIFAGGDAPKQSLSKTRTEKYNVPIYANAVKDNGLYGYTETARVKNPSVTVAARGSGTGHTEVRYEAFLPIVRLIVLTPIIQKVNVDYLHYAIKNLDILRSGSAIPQLTVPMIKNYAIPVPDFSTQLEVINRFALSKGFVDDLMANYLAKLNLLDELRKSILQKAFSGELTSKDAEGAAA